MSSIDYCASQYGFNSYIPPSHAEQKRSSAWLHTRPAGAIHLLCSNTKRNEHYTWRAHHESACGGVLGPAISVRTMVTMFIRS